MTIQVNMHEAKSKLSKLAELACQGEKVVIAKAGKPYLDLVPHTAGAGKRKPGRLAGQINIHANFDVVDSEIVAEFAND